MPETNETSLASTRPRDILQLAAWFGLVAGLVEGLSLLTLQKLDWLGWPIAKKAVSMEIAWISPLVDLALFLGLGAVLALAAKVFPRTAVAHFAVLSLGFLTFYDWLVLVGRFRHYGCFVFALGLATVLWRWFRRRAPAALQFCRRTLPWAAAITALAFLFIQGSAWLGERFALARLPTPPRQTPNVLVLVVDTLRADHLSTYGYARKTSPNVDRLARLGVLFENAYSTSSWTLPSHASLLTGRYPHEHGAETLSYDGRYPSLAEALRDRGYRTAAFSGNNLWFSRRRGFGKGFAHFEDYFNTLGDMFARTVYGREVELFVLPRLGYDNLLGRKGAEDVNRAVLRWLERDSGRPFFVFVNYLDVHDPYVPPQPYRSKFSRERNPGGIINTWFDRYYPKMTPAQLQGEMDAYDGAIVYTDEQIGRLLEELRQRGLSQNTLVVITSDHGESFGEHGLLIHQNALYREVICVPLVLFWPGHVPGGVRVSQLVSNASLPATVMELLGEGTQARFPGPSLMQLWQESGEGADWPYPLAELARFPGELVEKNPSASGAMRCLITPQWHYIWHEKFGPALYDWHRDPGESQDLSKTEDGQKIVNELDTRIRAMLASGSTRR